MNTNTEKQRIDFVIERDGLEAALDFAHQGHTIYRQSVLKSRKRGHTKPCHASLPEYRRSYIESYAYYKQFLSKHNRLKGQSCTK